MWVVTTGHNCTAFMRVGTPASIQLHGLYASSYWGLLFCHYDGQKIENIVLLLTRYKK